MNNIRIIRTKQGTRFAVGELEGEHLDWTLAVAEIGLGNIGTAVEVAGAIAHFTPHLLLFVGVAGSLKPEDLRKGDVVVADRVYNLHSGKVAHEDGTTVQLTRPRSFVAKHRLIQLAMEVRRADWTDEVLELSESKVAEPVAPRNDRDQVPTVQILPIVAGEIVLADDQAQLTWQIRERFNDAGAIDMESHGLYEAAHRHDDLGVLSVRGISDLIGDKEPSADKRWQTTAAAHAAGFAVALLKRADRQDLLGSTTPENKPIASDSAGIAQPKSDTRRDEATAVLRNLPPNVASMYWWARRNHPEAADSAVIEMAAHTVHPVGWLGRLRHRPPAWLKTDTTGEMWALVGTFADAYAIRHAMWAYEQAATCLGDGLAAALMLCRAALVAAREGELDKANSLIAAGHHAEPRATVVTELLAAVVEEVPSTVLSAALVAASNLEVNVPESAIAVGRDSVNADEAFSASRSDLGSSPGKDAFDEMLDVAPELISDTYEFIGMIFALALRASGRESASLDVFQAVDEGRLIPTGRVSPELSRFKDSTRPAIALFEQARTLLNLVLSPLGPPLGFEVSRTLAEVEELALTARDRRRDWRGPTGEMVAIAGRARAAAGDPRGALRLLLAPPGGTATTAESSHPDVAEVAAMAATMTGDTRTALQLAEKVVDPVERDLIRGVAFSATINCEDAAAEAYRSALGGANRTDQRTRALLGLARLGQLDDGILAALGEEDPEAANLVKASAYLKAGRHADALLLTRQYPHSNPALQVAVNAYLADGRPQEAVGALERAALRRGENDLLTEALFVALRADLLGEAARLAQQGLGDSDPRRRQLCREALLDIAGKQGNWDEVIHQARDLLDDGPLNTSDPDRTENVVLYRWALATALTNVRRLDQAWGVVEKAGAPLVPQKRDHAMLMLVLLNHAATNRVASEQGPTLEFNDIVSRATRIARTFADDEEIAAAAMMLTLVAPVEGSIIPDDLLAEVRTLQEEFFTRFPETHYIRRIMVSDDDLTELTDFLRETFAPGAAHFAALSRKVWCGEFPYGVLSSVANRPYCEALIKRAAGCYVVQFPDDGVLTSELAAAVDALDGSLVIDTSTLVLIEHTVSEPIALLAHFDGILLPEICRDDILKARNNLLLRSSGSLGWDHVANQPTITKIDEQLVDDWAVASERIVTLSEYCAATRDPVNPAGRSHIEPWEASILLAKERGLPLLADDASLRSFARSEGIPTFGSLQLVNALVSEGKISGDLLASSYERLRCIRAVDLPLSADLLSICIEDHWLPSGYGGLMLSRPSSWIPADTGFRSYAAVIRGLPDPKANVGGWCAAALTGIGLVTLPAERTRALAALIAWTTLNVNSQVHLGVIWEAVQPILSELVPVGDVLLSIVDVLVDVLRGVLPINEVGGALLQVLEGLDDTDRERAIRHFLTNSGRILQN